MRFPIITSTNFADMLTVYPLVFQTILATKVVDHYEAMLEVLWGPNAYVKWGLNRDDLYKAKQKVYEKEKKKLMADLKAFFPTLCKQWGVLIDAVMNLNHNDPQKIQNWRDWTEIKHDEDPPAERTFGQPIIADDDDA